MKKLMMAVTVMMAATAVLAAPTRSKKTKAAAEPVEETATEKTDVKIDIYPRLGHQTLLSFPKTLDGSSTIGRCYTGKPRQWIVLECKYTTKARCVEQLNFTWHVVLDTKTATNKDKEGQSKMSRFSYFTTTTTYVNIPKGSHCASVCLHPSYLERFGEPCAVSLVVSDANGEIPGLFRTESSIKAFKGSSGDYRFWDDKKSMEETESDGRPVIELRQGLQDRSKTIWALVNSDDFELVQ